MSASEWKRLVAVMERRRYGRGEVVLARGEADRSLFLIASGTVEVLVHEGSKQRWVREQGPGTVLGEVAFFDGMPRSATVRALTDCELFRMGADAFEVLAARHPDLGRRVLLELGRIVAARLRQAEGRGGA